MTESRPASDAVDPAAGSDVPAETVTESTEGAGARSGIAPSAAEEPQAPAGPSFDDIDLPAPLRRAVDELGFTTPSAIQAQAIPSLLEGRDVIGVAQTGTGKTASFTLPMITLLGRGRARARMPRSLVLCPTCLLYTSPSPRD